MFKYNFTTFKEQIRKLDTSFDKIIFPETDQNAWLVSYISLHPAEHEVWNSSKCHCSNSTP